MREATLLELKDFFGESSSAKFAKEWKELTPEDKLWFKQEGGRVMELEEVDAN